MYARTKRLGVAGALVGVTGILTLASAAFACTNLAALNLSSSSGQAGSQVTVTGSAFGRVPKNTPVDLHWNGLAGPILATVTPDAAGAINPTTLTIPADARPGFYTIVATQTEVATGLNPWGLPTRAGFTVEGPGVTTAQPAEAVSAGSPGDSGVSGGFIALTIALGLGGLVLFGLGAAAFLGTYRRRAATPSRVRS
jgi:hypothetical protein